MKVDVLNGVNLDVLERRDPAIYGGLSLHELEQRIEGWADELGHTVRCRHSNSEGEYVKFCHDSVDWAEGVIANPGAWSHYSYAIHDALELFSGPLVEVHLSNPEEREEQWRHHSVIARARDEANPRPRPRRLPRSARVPRSELVSERVDRLRERLEEPLLVSDAANVFYLSGLESSNAALLVEPERVRVFTDFRYAEAARAIDGVEFVEAKRDLFQTLSEILDGTIGFEATSLTFERHARLHAGGIDLVPRYGLVEELRAVKDEDELDSIRRAGAIVNIAFERFADQGDIVGHTERELAWRFEQFLHEANADGVSFPVHVASGPNAALPHANPGERRVEEGETVIVDAGCVVDGYCSDCTRTFASGPLPDELQRAYDVCLDAQLAGLEAIRPGASGPGVDSAARDRIEAAGFGEAFGHGLGHGVGILVHEDPRLAQESRSTLESGNVVTVEPGIYLPGKGGIRIEDLVVVTDDGPEVLTPFPKELRTLD